MPDNGENTSEESLEPDSAAPELGSHDRRSMLAVTSTVLMAGGLVGGYGTFFAMAGRFFFPSSGDKAWMFVANAASVNPGDAVPFESPTGVRVVVARSADSDKKSSDAESFLALSSVCPHLGCRVHWEQQNNRFFCPCHNGVFDPNGKAIGGPPAAAGQNLPQYPLKVVDGALYIEMPYRSV